jgi:hypothetical protein
MRIGDQVEVFRDGNLTTPAPGFVTGLNPLEPGYFDVMVFYPKNHQYAPCTPLERVFFCKNIFEAAKAVGQKYICVPRVEGVSPEDQVEIPPIGKARK